MSNKYFIEIAEKDKTLVNLDPGHKFVYTYGTRGSYPETLAGMAKGTITYADGVEGVLTGIIELHKNLDGEWCGGYISFLLPSNSSEQESRRPVWKVNSTDPLDIEPSLLCRGENCNSHGWIKDGKWVE